MNRRDFIKVTMAGSAGLVLSPQTTFGLKNSSGKRPNLLVIMTDQQRWDALSCAGNSILQTPNMDRLAKEGARFGLCHSQCPVCGPARTSLLTGCCIETTQCRTNMDANEKNISAVRPLRTYDEILSDAGYCTEYHGKWHAPLNYSKKYKNKVIRSGGPSSYYAFCDKYYPVPPAKAGQLIDTTWSRYPYTPNPLDARYVSPGQPPRKLKRPLVQPDSHGISEIPDGASVTAFQAQETLKALDRLKDGPFSLTCSFHFPHSPMLPGRSYAEMYDPDKMPVPQSQNDLMDNNPYRAANGRLRLPEYSDPVKIKYMIANYYALIKEIDDAVGKLLDKLDELGLSENTMVVFTSDHGEMLGAHGMREKNLFLEESVRVPLLIRFPGRIKPASVIPEPVSHIDLFATINDYLGVGDHPSDGISLRRHIEKKSSSADNFVVSEWNWPNFNPANIMIRTSEWKLMMPYDKESTSPNALFNLKDDPYEMNNLIGSNPARNKYKKRTEILRSKLIAWCKRTNHPYLENIKKRVLI